VAAARAVRSLRAERKRAWRLASPSTSSNVGRVSESSSKTEAGGAKRRAGGGSAASTASVPPAACQTQGRARSSPTVMSTPVSVSVSETESMPASAV
jgi:hypothetical protein